MATKRYAAADPALNDFYDKLAEESLVPLWELTGMMTAEPKAHGVPHRWAGKELRELGDRAGELVPVEGGGDRRVLVCANPGIDDVPYTTSSLWTAVQYLRGHEVAPAHRHTPAALRFIVEGEGVWTLVDGDPLHMGTGDLILTPSWTLHEHHNPTPDPMIWMDILDLPITLALDAVFFEPGPSREVTRATAPRSASEAWFAGAPGLVPADGPDLPARHSPLLAYRWADTERALEVQLAARTDGHARVRYTDPVRGTDVMPTMRCEMERIRPGVTTTTARQTGARVACVLHGTGRIVAGQGDQAVVFDVEPGDIVAIPSWVPRSVSADTQLDLFTTSDAPVLTALGLFRSETVSGASA